MALRAAWGSLDTPSLHACMPFIADGTLFYEIAEEVEAKKLSRSQAGKWE